MTRHIAQASPLPSRQRGVALLVVLMLSMVAMTAGLITAKGAETELQIAHNNVQGQRALAIAEAGLNHAIALIGANGLPFTDELDGAGGGGFRALSADTDRRNFVENGVTNVYRFRAFGSDNVNDGYFVRVTDNFDEIAGADNPQADIDNRIKVISRGRFGNAERTLTVQIGVGPPAPSCAIVTEGNLQIGGSARVTGAQGCVHSNAHLTISGNPNLQTGAHSTRGMTISGNPTMAGTQLTGALGSCGGGRTDKECYALAEGRRPRLPVPNVRPFAFGPQRVNLVEAVRTHANGYRLDKDGSVHQGGAWVCAERDAEAGNEPNCTGGTIVDPLPANFGWSHAGSSTGKPNAKWVHNGNLAVDGIFLVEGEAVVSGNAGEGARSDWRATIIAFNSIEISGNPTMIAFDTSATGSLRNLLLVSGNDVKIGGNVGESEPDTLQNTNYFGAIFAHQQVVTSGNPRMRGKIVAEDAHTDPDRVWNGDPAPACHSNQNHHCDNVGNSFSGSIRIHFDALPTGGDPPNITRNSFAEAR